MNLRRSDAINKLVKMITSFKTEGEIKENYNLSHLTWFKVGGIAQIFFKPTNIEDLQSVVKQNATNLPITILGAGSNTIIRDGGIDGLVIKLGKSFTDIQYHCNKLKVGAGCLNFNLAKFCLNESIAGFEFLVGIPGTIGGGIIMNAGAYNREFKDILSSIEVISSTGDIINVDACDIVFKYRGTNLPKDYIVVSATFNALTGDVSTIKTLMQDINAKRSTTQPVKEKTSGSTFANPKEFKAWELIDKAGLRGYRIGGASMSKLHCNFMINDGSATAHDLESLGEYVKAQVFKQTGISLEWEVKRIGKYV